MINPNERQRSGYRLAAHLQLPWIVVTLAITVVGCWLRFAELPSQMLGGDEMHAVKAAQSRPLIELLGYHLPAENSVPLTLYARVLMELGVFDELAFRLPMIAAGLLLPLVPWLFRRRLGAGACLIATALLTVWPMSLYYSFVARPYAPAALFLLLACVCWQRWVVEGSGRYLYLFSLSAALACYFHVLCVFPVLWLFLISLLEARQGVIKPREIGLALLTTGAMGMMLLGPGLPGLIEHRLLESERPQLGTPAIAWAGYLQLAGTEPANALVLLVAAVAGAVQIHRSHKALGKAFAGVPVVVLVGMFATQPFPTAAAWARYQFLAWPVVLLLVAVAVDTAIRTSASRRTPALFLFMILGLILVGYWAWADPMAGTLPRAHLPWLLAPPCLAASLAAWVTGSGDEVARRGRPHPCRTGRPSPPRRARRCCWLWRCWR